MKQTLLFILERKKITGGKIKNKTGGFCLTKISQITYIKTRNMWVDITNKQIDKHWCNKTEEKFKLNN